jgi:hypothetical protein
LRYGIILWGAVNGSKKAFIIQKKMLQTIKGVNNRVSCRQIFKDCKILTLTSLYILKVLCYLKKNKIYNIQNKNIHNYSTRGQGDLYILPCNTLHCKNSVINMGIKLYNLPTEIKKADRFKLFKNKLRKILLKQSFYYLEEFFSYGKGGIK